MESENVAVIGAGSWGTALAISLAKGGHHVSLWARREDAARLMSEERHNPTYLPDAIIPDSVHVTHDLAEAIHGATIWLIATPSQTVRQVAKDLDSYLTPDVVVVSVAKGIENGTLLTTSCVLHDAFSDLPRDRIAVLYGPSHAEEVASECPTTVVAASTNRETAKRVQRTFMTCHLRVYVNHDTRGVEIAGSVKNVLAIAAGISDGVGFGDNAKAAILTRGLAEIKRLGVAMGADPSTFAGLAGIGDMVVTCMSTLSRNRNLGYELGKGKSLERVQSEMTMVAEGVRTTASVVELAKKYEVEMPITEAVYRILFENEPPREAVSTLMMRTAKQEAWTPIDTDD
ncbi:MAG: NAD(P)H-dependent glycerol-3-phosphate dehydrogenase [Bacteroidetes Order II. Incertae sedis bacterium]|nr:NAD(P)H-dependent glycerol-3-phosphate dehydrogenase [Bacteroidetes Order II. bacterium]MBT4601617.1 NAD(P)H-dependent glycerol-3-phosphate dehydrogenase [Bacteroidetes Order II. bacterium]MBT5250970.1 NAD(P)H-dependent glycerol-3-phosphate dehydrogenase [Bacteroidetes Order II. bacterium]MBT6201333.1 NAD(P)H-dependent glycerol-3-phosphate dehydrogenase [Bacteroidetes Order II. bacterium]MBT6425337.1 NAD(P)H-dependent glycerol-3-phosphate dehydrogenase [Bacteroidetes Order II. bacterium]